MPINKKERKKKQFSLKRQVSSKFPDFQSKGFCEKMYIYDLGISCFQTQPKQLNNLGESQKVSVIMLLSRQVIIVEVFHQ